MSKFAALFMVALLLSTALTYARPAPDLVKTQNQDAATESNEIDHEENCEGVERDECLMRRTLAAHLDYIYTQRHHNP
ncbi:phytosulfokines-like [Rhododendron vialii]|uniref:phytosulfokines-like n=1 Tax=Rhododendron vialii TaxID=182163 RepID=UPI00265F0003|nr:phytosulfokines-like [Rhododendron vialii]